MLDEQAVEDPSLVQQIRDHYVDDGLPSFGALSDDWTMVGDELERLDDHQQQIERTLAVYVLDTDWAILPDLDDAIEAVLEIRDEFPDRADDTFPTEQ